MNIANDIYAQRKAERDERRTKREALEKKVHDAFLKGEPRYQRANQFAHQVMALLRDYIPEACIRQAHDDLVLNAFGLDVEIVQVPPERDAEREAALKAAALSMMVPKIIKVEE